MAIDTNADFTPSIPDSGVVPTKLPYNPTGSFKFWAQKVIPLVYDDSLSYYEVLCKVVNYLNDVIQNVDNLNDSVDSTNQNFEELQTYVNSTKDELIDTYNELQGYVNTYFDNLDVQEEINEKLDEMAASGSLSALLAPFLPAVVADWLSTHITPTTPAIDNTLSVSGAGADAKVTGDKFKEIEGEVDNIYDAFESFGEAVEIDQIIEGTNRLVSTYKYMLGDVPGNSVVDRIKVITTNASSASYVTLEIWKKVNGSSTFARDSVIEGKVTGTLGSLYVLEFDALYADEEMLLVLHDASSGGFISQSAVEGFSIKRFNAAAETITVATMSTLSDVKVSYYLKYTEVTIDEAVDNLENAVDVGAIAFDNVNQPNVSTLSSSKKWVCAFLKAGTYVSELELQIATATTDYLSLQLWETDNGVDYTYKWSLSIERLEARTNQSVLIYAPFKVTKDSFICTSDSHGTGLARRTTNGGEILYFNGTDESIRVANMSVLSGSSVCYKIKYFEPENKAKKVVIVSPDGKGDYLTILDAIQREPEGTPIYICPGVYEQDMTTCLKKNIILIGADRNRCIIKDTDGRYEHHPLYVSCGYFENLTIMSEYVSGTSQEIGTDNGSYAVHIDNDNDYGVGKQIEFHHCNISSDFFPAIGAGLRKNLTMIIDDCVLSNNQVDGRGKYASSGTLGALYFHDSNGEQGDQFVFVKDSVFKSKLANAMCIYKVDRDPQNNEVYCNFINNVLFSDVNRYSNNIWFRNDPFNESTGIFHIDIGYGNSNSDLNNNS